MKARSAVLLFSMAMLCASALAEEDAQYWYEQGLKLNANQSYEEAVQAYDNAIRLDSMNPEYWYGRAASLHLSHRDSEATESWKRSLQLYNETLENDSGDIDAWTGKGRTFMMLALSDRPELRLAYRTAELDAFDQALKADPQNSTLLYFRGSALYELKRYGEAVAALDQALKVGVDPSRPWVADGASHLKGMAEAALGRTNESAQSYGDALKSLDLAIERADSPENLSEAWAQKGLMLEEQGSLNESVKAFDNATDANPENEMAWKIKGFMLANWMGRYQEGLDALDRALEIRQSADVWEAKARVFNELGRYDDALDASDMALSLDRNLTRTWLVRGRALLELGRYQEALDAYSHVEKEDGALLAGRGSALLGLNKSREAVEAFSASLNLSKSALEEDNKSAYSWFWKAEALRGLGLYPEALDAYNRSLESGLDSAISSWRGKGFALEALCHRSEANAAFSRAEELGYEASAPQRTSADGAGGWSADDLAETADCWISRADSLSQNGSFEDASLAYQRALEFDPDNETIWFRYATELSVLGKENESARAYEKALDLLNESLAKNPQDAEAWDLFGLTLCSLGMQEEGYRSRIIALELLNDTLEADPENASAWLSKAEILVFLGQDDEALKAYNKVIELRPDEYGVMQRIGESLSAMGRHNESVKAYDRAIEKIPANDTIELGRAWSGKGYALWISGRNEEALDAFSNASNLNPGEIFNWIKVGDLAFELGRNDESLEAYDHILRQDPKNVQALSSKASILSEMERYNESLEAYDELLQVESSASAWISRGEVLEDMCRCEDASASYQRAEEVSSAALRSDANDTSAWLENGDALLRLGRYDEALSAYDGAIESSTSILGYLQRSEAWAGKGAALHGENKSEEALDAYNRAIDLNPANVDAWKGRAEVQRTMGDVSGANISLHVARALSSNVG